MVFGHLLAVVLNDAKILPYSSATIQDFHACDNSYAIIENLVWGSTYHGNSGYRSFLIFQCDNRPLFSEFLLSLKMSSFFQYLWFKSVLISILSKSGKKRWLGKNRPETKSPDLTVFASLCDNRHRVLLVKWKNQTMIDYLNDESL